MTTLKDAVLWCARLEVPFQAQDVADMAATALPATRAYLSRQATAGVVRALPDGSYAAGDPKAIHALRTTPTNAKPGGGAADYRRGKAARDRLLTAEADARRSGLLTRTNANPCEPMRPHANLRELTILDSGLTKDEFADSMRVTKRCIEKWIKAGRVTIFLTPGGRTRIPMSELTRMLAKPGKEAIQ